MKIVSDRNPRFQDALWKELMLLMGVKMAMRAKVVMRMTTPYNPLSMLRDAQIRLELAQQRQQDLFYQRHGQREYAVGDLVWVEAKHLTEKLMNRSLCRKLSKRWHGPLAVTERFYSDLQAGLPEADRGAPVAYRLQLPPGWRMCDVFAQHRLKPYMDGAATFASRRQLTIQRK
eukprot:gene8702-biopygen8848